LKTTGAGATPRRALLSIGGWNQGHCERDATTGQYGVCQGPSDRTDVVNCWEYCFNDTEGFASQLVALARGNGFDGVELDYEGQDASLSTAEQNFVTATTAALRRQWPTAVISHTLMEIYIEDQNGAVAMERKSAADLDFTSIQFYNFGPSPLDETTTLTQRFALIADGAFGGDAHKVVAGLTISEANDPRFFVPTGKEACTIVADLKQNYTKGIGGIMLWESRTDPDGAWAGSVAGCL
jgi:chitinase